MVAGSRLILKLVKVGCYEFDCEFYFGSDFEFDCYVHNFLFDLSSSSKVERSCVAESPDSSVRRFDYAPCFHFRHQFYFFYYRSVQAGSDYALLVDSTRC